MYQIKVAFQACVIRSRHAQPYEIHNNYELIWETVLQDETEWLGVEDSNLYWRSQSP